MQKIRFEEAVKIIRKKDERFSADAYRFLRDALDHTVKNLRGDELIEHRHVSGPELLAGVVQYSLREFGSMASVVLDSWGIQKGEDIGAMVFNLIGAGAFGKSEEDCPSDFANVMDLREELRMPYRPSRRVLASQMTEEAGEFSSTTRGMKPASSKEA